MLKKRKNKRVAYDRVGYLLILPYMLFNLIFIFLPIIMNIYISFTNYNLVTMKFIGLDNYKYMLIDKFFIKSIGNTAIYTVVTLSMTLALGLIIANVLNKKIAGLKFYRASFFIPYVTSMVSVSMIWLWMYEPTNGIFNNILGVFGIKKQLWLFDVNLALVSIILMSIWKSVGYSMIVYLAGLQGIPPHLYEAASIDGAGPLRQFIHITLPMLKPITFFLVVTGTINNFRVFEQVQIMTNGGPMNATTTIVHQIFNRGFSELKMGYAASLSVVLFIVVAILTIMNFRFGKSGQDLELG